MTAKILVIDDSMIALQWARMNLSPLGFEVATHSTPIGTQDLVSRTQPDIILLDVGMPSLSGDLLCKMLKDNPRTKGTTVALYSSLPEEELKDLVAKSGADGYIQKTDDITSLGRQINALLAKKSTKAVRPANQPVKITYVDDSLITLQWVRNNLAQYGFEVDTCQDPLEAKAIIASSRPEVILLDVRMPRQSGDIMCKLLKLSPETSHIGVILYSELPEEELKRLAHECLADGYVEKTEGVEDLASAIARVMERKGTGRGE